MRTGAAPPRAALAGPCRERHPAARRLANVWACDLLGVREAGDATDELEQRIRLHLTPHVGGRRLVTNTTPEINTFILTITSAIIESADEGCGPGNTPNQLWRRNVGAVLAVGR